MSSQPPRRIIHLPKIRMLSRGGRATLGIGGPTISTRTMKPPNPEILKQQEEAKLRAQLKKEIAWRSRSCAHKAYECMLPVVTGRQYCSRHILQDPTAPYKQCAHVYGNGARCEHPAPADNREHRDSGLCFEHARAALQGRQRSTAPAPPVDTTEALLHQLQHYIRPERTRTTSCASSVSVVSEPADQEPATLLVVDPYKQIDACQVNASYSSTIIEGGSCSDSDADSVTVDVDNWRGVDDSDDEAPCESQPLWRAGVYTAEEAVSEANSALKALQSAYIKQLDRLRTLLQIGRANYLKNLKVEKEQYCSINSQARSGPLSARERRQLRKLKAYASYRRAQRAHAVLARKLHKKRSKVNEIASNRPIPSQGRCTFSEYGARCLNHTLPATKHCAKHILFDPAQVLFARCEDTRTHGAPCAEPVPRLPLPARRCRYHTDPPRYCVFTTKKEDSDSETGSHSSSDSQTDQSLEKKEIAEGAHDAGAHELDDVDVGRDPLHLD